jgi:hypothetical protein
MRRSRAGELSPEIMGDKSAIHPNKAIFHEMGRLYGYA